MGLHPAQTRNLEREFYCIITLFILVIDDGQGNQAMRFFRNFEKRNLSSHKI
jgi:hypothetical protein